LRGGKGCGSRFRALPLTFRHCVMANDAMELNCVRLAKGLNAVLADPTAENYGQRWGKIRSHQEHTKAVRTHYSNGIVQVCAENGDLDRAQHWMRKFDTRKGVSVGPRTFNTLLHSLGARGQLEKAEDWFGLLKRSPLHPEFENTTAGSATFDVMVQTSAKAQDVIRTQKYLDEAAEASVRLSLKSLVAAGNLFLKIGEYRRLQSLCDQIVRQGCSLRPGYPPQVIRGEKQKARSQRQPEVDSFVALVSSLARALADMENTHSANRWLQYLSDAGIGHSTMPELWDHVRAKTPLDIVPAQLSCEKSWAVQPTFAGGRRPQPMMLRPGILAGEKVATEYQAAALLDIQDAADGSTRPGSNSTMPAFETRPNTAGWQLERYSPAAPGDPRRPMSARGAADGSQSPGNPSLRRLLTARSHVSEVAGGRPHTSPGYGKR